MNAIPQSNPDDKPLTDIAFSNFDLHPAVLAGLESAAGIGSRAGSIARSCVIFGSWSIVLGIGGCPLAGGGDEPHEHATSRRADPALGGWLAARRGFPCAAGEQTKNRGPWAHGPWLLRKGGSPADQLPGSGHSPPVTIHADRRDDHAGEQRRAVHLMPPPITDPAAVGDVARRPEPEL